MQNRIYGKIHVAALNTIVEKAEMKIDKNKKQLNT